MNIEVHLIWEDSPIPSLPLRIFQEAKEIQSWKDHPTL